MFDTALQDKHCSGWIKYYHLQKLTRINTWDLRIPEELDSNVRLYCMYCTLCIFILTQTSGQAALPRPGTSMYRQWQVGDIQDEELGGTTASCNIENNIWTIRLIVMVVMRESWAGSGQRAHFWWWSVIWPLSTCLPCIVNTINKWYDCPSRSWLSGERRGELVRCN